MSRTYKDRPWRVQFPKVEEYGESIPYIASGKHWSTGEPYERLSWYSLQQPYIKPKKAKRQDKEYHWMTTPGWWIRLQMTRPQRNASNQYMRQVHLEYNLDELDPPPIGRKPHIYYW